MDLLKESDCDCLVFCAAISIPFSAEEWQGRRSQWFIAQELSGAQRVFQMLQYPTAFTR